jgi:hypothetical protein
MIKISKKMLLYGGILFLLTVVMIVVSQQSGNVADVFVLVAWALGYTLITYLFLSREDQAKTRGNLKLSYGLVGLISVIPLVILADVILSAPGANPLLERIWVVPALSLIVGLNIVLHQRRLKGYSKQEVFK